MYSYVTKELPQLILSEFKARKDAQGIFGHSMGGHGALVSALRNAGQYRSVSAFAPIAAPMRCPWGQKAFSGYLGENKVSWADYDASVLVAKRAFARPILVDQGTADKFLAEQLYPQVFADSCRQSGTSLTLRMQDGYDHGYYFISTFIADHVQHHAKTLTGSA